MANKKRAKTAIDKEEIIEIMQATQEPFLKLAELWHAATGRRPEEIFALRHCDIDTKRRKFRPRGNWLAYDGLCRTQRLAKVLCSALIILYDRWLPLVVVVVLLLLQRLAHAIMSSRDRFASGDCCCFGFGGCCCGGCGCGCVNLDSLSSCSPIASSSFVAFSITRGVELSHLYQASFSAMIAASFFFSASISCWLISNCCFFMW